MSSDHNLLTSNPQTSKTIIKTLNERVNKNKSSTDKYLYYATYASSTLLVMFSEIPKLEGLSVRKQC